MRWFVRVVKRDEAGTVTIVQKINVGKNERMRKTEENMGRRNREVIERDI